ncbi:MAG TPA: VacJ family lipoprotein [Stellaceae bacterium]|nr:VacJ family lipoprotein [Stellaceae bacterium]
MHSRILPLMLPALLVAAFSMAGCAAPATGGGPQPQLLDQSGSDPFEETNRAVFRFNNAFYHDVMFPVAKGYRTVLPPPVRKSVHNFLQNLNGPDIFANDVLQGRPDLASNTFGRLLVNTTFGVGGMFDVASLMGIPYHTNDFGITLATWGVYSGPYLVVPVLGPANPRQLVGQVADSFGDPGDYVASQHGYLWAAVVREAVAGIDTMSRNLDSLEDIEKTSLDYYATIRSLYWQRRAAEIRHENSNLPNPSPVTGGD